MTDIPNEIGDGFSLQEVKQMRRDHPTGWLELSMYESRALLIDAILDLEPGFEVTHSDLANRAGITDESVRNHIGVLLELGIVEQIEGGGVNRYVVNDGSSVLFELENLNSTVNAIRAGGSVDIEAEELDRRTRTRVFELTAEEVLWMEFGEVEEEDVQNAPGIEDINNFPEPSGKAVAGE